MSQSSAATTLLKAPDLTLKGGLQSVLQSLDIQLEDELMRYRDQKQRQAQLDQAAEAAARARRSEQAPPNPVPSPAPGHSAPSQPQGAATPAPASATGSGLAVIAPESMAPESMAPESMAPEPNGAASPALASASPAPDLASTAAPNPAPSAGLAQEASAEDATAHDGLAHDGLAQDDYFASSAALLESLGTMPETDLEGIEFQPLGNPFLAKLMTPVGVGAALLVLVGGSVAGYLLSNPSSVSHLSIGRFFPENSTAQGADNAQAAGSAGPSAGPKVIPAELPPGAPDLTQREFIQLSLSNLGTIDPQGNPIYSPFSLGGLGSPGSLAGSTAGPTLAIAPSQALPNGLTTGLPGTGIAGTGLPGITAPGGAAASLPTSLPNGAQVIQPGLLAGLSSAVAGQAVTQGLMGSAPSPRPIPSPGITAAPALRFQPEQPLPTPSGRSTPRAAAPAPAAPSPKPAAPVQAAPDQPAPAPKAAVRDLDAPIPFEPIPRGNAYVVEVPYTSDALLAEVQQLFPDSGAYVENHADAGAVIQVGIYDDAGSAGEIVNTLSSNGIDAKVENR